MYKDLALALSHIVPIHMKQCSKILVFSIWCLTTSGIAWSQIKTANDYVKVYTQNFNFGMNMGYYGPKWTDEQISDIILGNSNLEIAGLGCNSLRLSLPESFLEKYGYDIRNNAFEHYGQLGAKNNTIFLGSPSDLHVENKNYCSNESSKMFANLYEPIWDNGVNGTPVNENNYFAQYVYRVAKKYTENVTFWEIIHLTVD